MRKAKCTLTIIRLDTIRPVLATPANYISNSFWRRRRNIMGRSIRYQCNFLGQGRHHISKWNAANITSIRWLEHGDIWLNSAIIISSYQHMLCYRGHARKAAAPIEYRSQLSRRHFAIGLVLKSLLEERECQYLFDIGFFFDGRYTPMAAPTSADK